MKYQSSTVKVRKLYSEGNETDKLKKELLELSKLYYDRDTAAQSYKAFFELLDKLGMTYSFIPSEDIERVVSGFVRSLSAFFTSSISASACSLNIASNSKVRTPAFVSPPGFSKTQGITATLERLRQEKVIAGYVVHDMMEHNPINAPFGGRVLAQEGSKKKDETHKTEFSEWDVLSNDEMGLWNNNIINYVAIYAANRKLAKESKNINPVKFTNISNDLHRTFLEHTHMHSSHHLKQFYGFAKVFVFTTLAFLAHSMKRRNVFDFMLNDEKRMAIIGQLTPKEYLFFLESAWLYSFLYLSRITNSNLLSDAERILSEKNINEGRNIILKATQAHLKMLFLRCIISILRVAHEYYKDQNDVELSEVIQKELEKYGRQYEKHKSKASKLKVLFIEDEAFSSFRNFLDSSLKFFEDSFNNIQSLITPSFDAESRTTSPDSNNEVVIILRFLDRFTKDPLKGGKKQTGVLFTDPQSFDLGTDDTSYQKLIRIINEIGNLTLDSSAAEIESVSYSFLYFSSGLDSIKVTNDIRDVVNTILPLAIEQILTGGTSRSDFLLDLTGFLYQQYLYLLDVLYNDDAGMKAFVNMILDEVITGFAGQNKAEAEEDRKFLLALPYKVSLIITRARMDYALLKAKAESIKNSASARSGSASSNIEDQMRKTLSKAASSVYVVVLDEFFHMFAEGNMNIIPTVWDGLLNRSSIFPPNLLLVLAGNSPSAKVLRAMKAGDTEAVVKLDISQDSIKAFFDRINVHFLISSYAYLNFVHLNAPITIQSNKMALMNGIDHAHLIDRFATESKLLPALDSKMQLFRVNVDATISGLLKLFNFYEVVYQPRKQSNNLGKYNDGTYLMIVENMVRILSGENVSVDSNTPKKELHSLMVRFYNFIKVVRSLMCDEPVNVDKIEGFDVGQLRDSLLDFLRGYFLENYWTIHYYAANIYLVISMYTAWLTMINSMLELMKSIAEYGLAPFARHLSAHLEYIKSIIAGTASNTNSFLRYNFISLYLALVSILYVDALRKIDRNYIKGYLTVGEGVLNDLQSCPMFPVFTEEEINNFVEKRAGVYLNFSNNEDSADQKEDAIASWKKENMYITPQELPLYNNSYAKLSLGAGIVKLPDEPYLEAKGVDQDRFSVTANELIGLAKDVQRADSKGSRMLVFFVLDNNDINADTELLKASLGFYRILTDALPKAVDKQAKANESAVIQTHEIIMRFIYYDESGRENKLMNIRNLHAYYNQAINSFQAYVMYLGVFRWIQEKIADMVKLGSESESDVEKDYKGYLEEVLKAIKFLGPLLYGSENLRAWYTHPIRFNQASDRWGFPTYELLSFVRFDRKVPYRLEPANLYYNKLSLETNYQNLSKGEPPAFNSVIAYLLLMPLLSTTFYTSKKFSIKEILAITNAKILNPSASIESNSAALENYIKSLLLVVLKQQHISRFVSLIKSPNSLKEKKIEHAFKALEFSDMKTAISTARDALKNALNQYKSNPHITNRAKMVLTVLDSGDIDKDQNSILGNALAALNTLQEVVHTALADSQAVEDMEIMWHMFMLFAYGLPIKLNELGLANMGNPFDNDVFKKLLAAHAIKIQSICDKISSKQQKSADEVWGSLIDNFLESVLNLSESQLKLNKSTKDFMNTLRSGDNLKDEIKRIIKKCTTKTVESVDPIDLSDPLYCSISKEGFWPTIGRFLGNEAQDSLLGGSYLRFVSSVLTAAAATMALIYDQTKDEKRKKENEEQLVQQSKAICDAVSDNFLLVLENIATSFLSVQQGDTSDTAIKIQDMQLIDLGQSNSVKGEIRLPRGYYFKNDSNTIILDPRIHPIDIRNTKKYGVLIKYNNIEELKLILSINARDGARFKYLDNPYWSKIFNVLYSTNTNEISGQMVASVILLIDLVLYYSGVIDEYYEKNVIPSNFNDKIIEFKTSLENAAKALALIRDETKDSADTKSSKEGEIVNIIREVFEIDKRPIHLILLSQLLLYSPVFGGKAQQSEAGTSIVDRLVPEDEYDMHGLFLNTAVEERSIDSLGKSAQFSNLSNRLATRSMYKYKSYSETSNSKVNPYDFELVFINPFECILKEKVD